MSWWSVLIVCSSLLWLLWVSFMAFVGLFYGSCLGGLF